MGGGYFCTVFFGFEEMESQSNFGHVGGGSRRDIDLQNPLAYELDLYFSRKCDDILYIMTIFYAYNIYL